jgi:UDP-N-acetylglucosamine--N-acetylmuramyl-(pentapeptide) pyrophosphoryl-undecaprenol N-acetylglucosamine transferase
MTADAAPVRIMFAGGGTGGHLYPGLAIARALVRLRPEVRPFFVGAQRGIERDVLPTTEFEHELLDLHPLYRQRPWRNWRTLVGLASSWRRIGARTTSLRPRLVVATGGYASGALLGYAAARRLPSVLQEQNSFPGMTTRFFARFAREVYLGFPEAARELPRTAATIVDTGNPIEPPARPPDRAAARAAWELPKGGHVLLIVGGSQGARPLNEAVRGWIDRGLPDGLHVIWSTGRGSFEEYARFDGSRVKVRPFLSPIADAYAAADLAIARAGAMTTAELCAWGIPAILVPLPTAAADHQTANARALEHAGAALCIRQVDFTLERLSDTVADLLARPDTLMTLAAAALRRGRPDAAETIARRILTLVRLGDLQS